MFRIGEFARIARVTARSLRHYESLGLIAPAHADPQTGYRYYSARQLPRLNRILALKDLGFTLEQIADLIAREPPVEELRGMLALRKAQAEQALAREAQTLRHIESRIRQIEEQGAMQDYDVVVKSAPAQPWVALRRRFPGMSEAVDLLRTIVGRTPAAVRQGNAHALTVVAHSDFEDDELDLEVGFTLPAARTRPVALGDGLALMPGELEAAPELACLVRSGPNYEAHLAFGALGIWMEAHRYRIAGACREVFLELPFAVPDSDQVVMEIQFPVRPAGRSGARETPP